jgi:hypothetical protein
MSTNRIKIQSLFPVELAIYEDGEVEITDITGISYAIKDKATGNYINFGQCDEIINHKLGFWEIAKRYNLVRKV